MEGSERGRVARWRTFGSFEVGDDGIDGNGAVRLFGNGGVSVWLRATVEYPREDERVRVCRSFSSVVEGDQAMLRS